MPDPKILDPKDVIVRVTHACVCGSDLWFYRGVSQWEPGWRTGHEWMGIVEEVGSEVNGFARGDAVIAPFAFSDGTCEFCLEGLHTSCINGGGWGGPENDGGQGELVRAPEADGTLVRVPEEVSGDAALLKSILPLTDVMGTGHHAAIRAGVEAGMSVAVVGDGAVGLCGVIAAKRLGAERILALGHHEGRLDLALRLGATHVLSSSGEELTSEVMEMTDGGAEAVLECVGAQSAMDTAIEICRPGGAVGFVGVPHGVEKVNVRRLFGENISLNGSLAPVRAYLPELMDDVIRGKIDPAPVLDMKVDLDGVPEAYAAMDSRRSIKVMIEL